MSKMRKYLNDLSKKIKSEFDFFQFDYDIEEDIVMITLNFKKRFKVDIEDIEKIKKVFNVFKQYGLPNNYSSIVFRDSVKSYYVSFEQIERMLGKTIRSIDIEYDFSTNREWHSEYKSNIKMTQYQIEKGLIDLDDIYREGDYYFIIKDGRSGKLLNSGDIEKSKPYYIYLGKEIDGDVKILSVINFYIPGNNNVFIVIKVYTLPNFRRKGYSFILHKFIQDKTGMKYDTKLEFTKSGFLHMLSNRKKILSEKLNKKMKYIKLFENFKF